MSQSPLILPYAGITPSFATPLAQAGEGSAILGRVTLGRHAFIGAAPCCAPTP
jgi:hypothetical protein